MSNKKRKDKEGLHIGGSVNISQGDFIAGDKNLNFGEGSVYVGGDMKGSKIAIGDHNRSGNLDTEREAFFEELFKNIEQLSQMLLEDKEELRTNVEEIKFEVEKGDKANENFLERRLRNIRRIAPDIGDVVIATLTSPAAGFAMVVKKVAERARVQS